MATPSLKKLGLRPDDVDFMFGSRILREEMVAAGWLTPVVRRHKLTLFDAGEVARAWGRILNGESPNRTNR
jgi:hypothetical protein